MNETPNIPMLRKAVEWVEEQAALPHAIRQWEQREWRIEAAEWNEAYPPLDQAYSHKSPDCGTCYCVAGYVDSLVDGEDTDEEDIEYRAADILGLTYTQRVLLFRGDNSAAEIRHIAEDMAGERI